MTTLRQPQTQDEIDSWNIERDPDGQVYPWRLGYPLAGSTVMVHHEGHWLRACVLQGTDNETESRPDATVGVLLDDSPLARDCAVPTTELIRARRDDCRPLRHPDTRSEGN